MDEEELSKRLDKIEHQLKFFADAYKHMHNTFINGIHVKFEKNLLEPTLSKLISQANYLDNLNHKLNELIKNDSIIGTLQFMSKRIHEMTFALNEIKEKGLKKNIHLDFTVDGYEMVEKKSVISEMKNESHEDSVKALLSSLPHREAQVLIYRFGLLGESGKTFKAIGKIMGVSPERIRAIQEKTLRKCRFPSRKNLVQALTHKQLKKSITGEEE